MAHQRLINWNDDYCPNGHRWVFCHRSNLYPDFYYCPKEDKMWEPTVAEIDEAKRVELHEFGGVLYESEDEYGNPVLHNRNERREALERQITTLNTVTGNLMTIRGLANIVSSF